MKSFPSWPEIQPGDSQHNIFLTGENSRGWKGVGGEGGGRVIVFSRGNMANVWHS
jgi:hypothetical protein